MPIARLVAGAATLMIAAALVVSGCGSSGKSTTTTGASQTETWVAGVCSAVVDYKGALKGAATTLKTSGVSNTNLNEAADTVKSATNTFVKTLDELGPPGTTAGQQAKETFTGLRSDLQQDAATVRSETSSPESTALSAGAVATSTLQTAQNQVKSAVDKLKSLDPTGELKAAFSKASECSSLQS
jgi:hypothetical protein